VEKERICSLECWTEARRVSSFKLKIVILSERKDLLYSQQQKEVLRFVQETILFDDGSGGA